MERLFFLLYSRAGACCQTILFGMLRNANVIFGLSRPWMPAFASMTESFRGFGNRPASGNDISSESWFVVVAGTTPAGMHYACGGIFAGTTRSPRTSHPVL